MTVQDIPPLNATLNGVATVLITTGFVLIKSGRKEAHRAVMLAAAVVSAVFLVGYVTHKVLKGYYASPGEALHTEFGGTGIIKTAYSAMLVSHILLAIAIAYLVPRTFWFALKGDYTHHKAWAKWTFPIWLYVSVTGVLVYFCLYVWWPAK